MNLSPGSKKCPIRAIFLVSLGLFSLSGCYIHHADYGSYRPSRDVGRIFQSGKFAPGYTYYYAHTHSRPEALIGIAPGYTLDNRLWTRAAPSELNRLVDNLWVRSGYSPLIFGSDIVSPEGKIVGIYYSQYNGGAIVMGPDNQVNVNLPNTELMRHRFPSFRFFMQKD